MRAVLERLVPLTCAHDPGTKPPGTYVAPLARVPETSMGAGALIASEIAPDRPPPGAGFNTVTSAVPTAAISEAVMAAVSCVELTNVVGRLAPFHSTADPF